MEEFSLRVWHLSQQSVRLIPADKTLAGYAHPDGVKYCGPFTNANKYGWWVLPPLDIDFIFHENGEFEHKLLSPWDNQEVDIMKSLIREDDTVERQTFVRGFGGRVKADFGRVEKNICQIWTGSIFQTPPGWGLMVRSPININMNVPYRIQEGILESSWMRYDAWLNVAVQRTEEWVKLRRDQWPPLAQIVPVKTEAYDKQWKLHDYMINRDSEEANHVYEKWAEYNYEKYVKMIDKKPKDPTTYYKQRKRHLNEVYPPQEQTQELPAQELPAQGQCPYMASIGKRPKPMVKKLIK